MFRTGPPRRTRPIPASATAAARRGRSAGRGVSARSELTCASANSQTSRDASERSAAPEPRFGTQPRHSGRCGAAERTGSRGSRDPARQCCARSTQEAIDAYAGAFHAGFRNPEGTANVHGLVDGGHNPDGLGATPWHSATRLPTRGRRSSSIPTTAGHGAACGSARRRSGNASCTIRSGRSASDSCSLRIGRSRHGSRWLRPGFRRGGTPGRRIGHRRVQGACSRIPASGGPGAYRADRPITR